jgi:muconolactone D-isomerase
MEFFVGIDVTIPDGTPESEVKERVSAEAIAAAGLARQGHLVRRWKPPVAPGQGKAVGLYRADSEAELDGLTAALPLDGWMQVTVTPLEAHPNDPASPRPNVFRLPDPRLKPVYRLEATLGEPVDLGDTDHGHRRIVPLSGRTFTGPTIQGKLLRGASADWPTMLPGRTAVGDIRYTLQTDGGDVRGYS